MKATVRDSASWTDLLRLAGAERGSRLLVEGLAAHLARASGLSSVAFYCDNDGQSERLAVAGEARFPDSPSDQHDFGMREVPDGVLLYDPPTVSASGLDDHALLTLVCAAQALRLRTRLKLQNFAANFRGVELQSLYDVGLAIARTLDLDQLGDEILLRAVSLLDARVGALYLRDGDVFRRNRTFGGEAAETVAPDDPGLIDLLEGKASDTSLLPGAQHQLWAPIEGDGRTLGLLAVADKESRTGIGPFAASDRRMLGLFANQAAIALENARLHMEALEKERLERELDLAADIQRKLLPERLPEVAGFEFAGWNRPARHVGGDYYDVRRLDDGGVHLVLADVSGKGMPAALLVSTLHSALRLLGGSSSFDAELVAHLNRHIVSSSATNKFITMTAAKLDPETGVVSYVNAGHNPPLVVRRNGEVEELPAGGMPLGIFDGAAYEVGTVELARGDLLCIFSDGITECESPEGEEFGEQRLAHLLLEVGEGSLPSVISAIDEACGDFGQGAPQGDDQTLVLLRRSP